MDVNGRIESEVGGWDGVTERPHQRGGRELRFGGRVGGRVLGRVSKTIRPGEQAAGDTAEAIEL